MTASAVQLIQYIMCDLEGHNLRLKWQHLYHRLMPVKVEGIPETRVISTKMVQLVSMGTNKQF